MPLKMQFLAIVVTSVILCGCGSEYPTVSGTVTIDGKPVSKIEVVFAPKSTENSAVVGPVSSAVTDSSGHFSLKTRTGSRGAVVGKHTVGFWWCDIHDDSLPALQAARREASQNAPDEATEITRRIESIKQKLKDRPHLPKNLQTEFELTAAGTTEANFELTDFGNEQP